MTIEENMSRVIAIVDDFLKSLQKPLPEVSDACKELSLRCANVEERDTFIREIVETLGKNDERIVQRDDAIILSGLEILPGLSLSDYWSELTPKTQDAIWKYINLILLAGAKHVRALDRKARKAGGESVDGNKLAESISDRLKDPEIRAKMMETIQKTMETLPETAEMEGAEEMVNELMGQLNGTNIGSLITDIVSDLSGELTPESLGLAEGTDFSSLDTDNMMEIFSNPIIATKLFGLVSKIGDKINGKIQSGAVDQQKLLEESQALLAKSGNLLKNMNPQMIEMMRSMGVDPDMISQMSSRKVRRAVEKKAKASKGKKGKVVRKRK